MAAVKTASVGNILTEFGIPEIGKDPDGIPTISGYLFVPSLCGTQRRCWIQVHDENLSMYKRDPRMNVFATAMVRSNLLIGTSTHVANIARIDVSENTFTIVSQTASSKADHPGFKYQASDADNAAKWAETLQSIINLHGTPVATDQAADDGNPTETFIGDVINFTSLAEDILALLLLDDSVPETLLFAIFIVLPLATSIMAAHATLTESRIDDFAVCAVSELVQMFLYMYFSRFSTTAVLVFPPFAAIQILFHWAYFWKDTNQTTRGIWANRLAIAHQAYIVVIVSLFGLLFSFLDDDSIFKTLWFEVITTVSFWSAGIYSDEFFLIMEV